jgi:hypothetical protein
MGTHVLVDKDAAVLKSELLRTVEGKGKVGSVPPLWDKHAGERIAGSW